ncbi:MAG: chromosome segregation protein SMC [Acidimicrobiales bacterium]
MYLKSLTLKGFKSFADTTSLHFEPGITVVVGPNGSGKSNVVDAVAWVLGAQGPRTLRSTKMDDVIFAGAANRAALGRAEVHLTVDNSSGMLPIDFTEVTISRTLFRTGASEYAINQVPCRLLDIQELLSDSGVGRTQHVIVGQGQLDAVLEARPEERRAVIEEAAGVLKFRRRKEKAERRLAATEGNLVRVSDLAREVRRQLRPLERQADAAQRHGALVEDLRAIQIHLAGLELAGISARRAAGEQARVSLEAEERRARAELAHLDAAIDAAEAELATTRAGDLADALVRVERLREQARGLAAVLAERRRVVERDREAALDQTVVATLEAEASRLQSELCAVDEEAQPLIPGAARLAEAESALAAEQARLDNRPAGGRTADDLVGPASQAGEVRACDATPASEADRVSVVRAEAGALATAVARDDAELSRARLRLASLEERSARLADEREALADRLAHARGDHDRLGPELDLARRRRSDAEAVLADAEAALRQADADRHTWAAHAAALAVALDEARARAGVERLAGVDDVAGILLELVEVDSGWEAAFEAAAGPALAAVVVAGGGEAVHRCLELLSGDGDGQATVLGLDIQRAPSPPPPLGEPVRSHVRPRQAEVAAQVAPLLDALVGGSVCVGGSDAGAWREALAAAVAHPDAVVVTLAGDRFAPDGWRVGGQEAGATRVALAEAERRAQEAAAAGASAEAHRRRAGTGLDQARQAESELGRRLQALDGVVGATIDALARVERESGDASVEAEEVRGHQAALQSGVEQERGRLVELEAALPALEAEEARSAECERERQAERSRLEERAQATTALRNAVEVRTTALAERRSWLQRRLAEVDARLSGDRARQVQARTRRQQLDARLTATNRLAALVAGHLAWLDTALADLRQRRRRQAERVRAGAEHLDGLRRRRGVDERHLAQLQERMVGAEMEAQELALRAEAAVEALRRDLDTEPDVAMKSPCPPLPAGSTAVGRARELERELRLMGPINPLALEEAVTLRERQVFLEGQLDDVRSSRRELAKVIRAVDDEIVNVFVSAFADVAENFNGLFSLLFPGGEGRLELTDPDNPLETGIRVRARPSGKNVRSIALLSGGERSLTALAYLFAVFRSRPSPFYVLDEVEAALDDVNLHRFLDLVGEFRREAQLLIVSHQQRTMEIADVLYGVTMAPGGASGVVSERITPASV